MVTSNFYRFSYLSEKATTKGKAGLPNGRATNISGPREMVRESHHIDGIGEQVLFRYRVTLVFVPDRLLSHSILLDRGGERWYARQVNRFTRMGARLRALQASTIYKPFNHKVLKRIIAASIHGG